MSRSPEFPPVGYAEWRRRVKLELGDAGFDDALTTRLLEGITTQPLYHERPATTRLGRKAVDNSLGWHLCPRYETADPNDANRQIRADLDGGATALWLRLDEAARLGVDPLVADGGTRVGRDGLPAYSTADLETTLAGVHLDALPILLDAGGNALPAAMSLLALGDRFEVDRRTVEWHCNMDPLAALAADGELPGSCEDLASEMHQLTSFCDAILPRSTAIAVSDLPYHQAGADAADELGIVGATLLTYLRWLGDDGLEPSVAVSRVLLRVAVDQDLFASVAKIRAARLLWRKVLTAVGLLASPPALIHAVGSDRPLTVRDPWVNMLRTTSQGLAAALGGADFATLPSYDRTLGPPSEAGRRLARNTQSILGEESALGQVEDPGAGSFYIEQLTDALARRAWSCLREIESQGGMLAVVRSGWLRERLASRWAARTSDLAHRRTAITGVSEYVNLHERPPSRDRHSSLDLRERALERARMRGNSSTEPPSLEQAGSLDRFSAGSRWAAAGATLAEISAALQREPSPTADLLPRHRDAEAFEALRDAAEARETAPTVYLERLGTGREHKARATFAANLFAAGGVAVAEADDFAASGAAVACLCGSDDAYAREGASRVATLRGAGANRILIAGRRESLDDPKAVDDEIYLGCDALAILGELFQ